MKRIWSVLMALFAGLCRVGPPGPGARPFVRRFYPWRCLGPGRGQALCRGNRGGVERRSPGQGLERTHGIGFSIAAAPAPDGLAVDWAKDSTLVAGLDDRAQKEEFFMYDVESLSWFMMDSLRPP